RFAHAYRVAGSDDDLVDPLDAHEPQLVGAHGSREVAGHVGGTGRADPVRRHRGQVGGGEALVDVRPVVRDLEDHQVVGDHHVGHLEHATRIHSDGSTTVNRDACAGHGPVEDVDEGAPHYQQVHLDHDLFAGHEPATHSRHR